MKTTDFDYKLSQDFIAQNPVSPRDSSRLMFLDRASKKIRHHIFKDLSGLLRSGDVLVFNDSKVMPARLFGRKERKGARLETLLLRDLTNGKWEVLIAPAKRVRVGTKIYYKKFLTKLVAEVLEDLRDGRFVIQFDKKGLDLFKSFARIGNAPLPPYISTSSSGLRRVKSQYQTVYAEKLGSAAAPTAGLHFTKKLLKNLKDKGIQTEFVTLHVGLGTFLPVKTDELTEHKMHSEYFILSEDLASRLNQAKKEGRRIIAVGTTSIRVLESCTDAFGRIKASSGETDIFIYPGYKWRFVDALITNFHLPKSTLLMLVSSFAGREFILQAYEEAKRNKYRFFSFGDGMMIE